MKRSWLKNLIKKCSKAMRSRMFNSMEKIMLMMRSTGQSREDFAKQVDQAMQAFYEQYHDEEEYVAYVKKYWGGKTGQPCHTLAC